MKVDLGHGHGRPLGNFTTRAYDDLSRLTSVTGADPDAVAALNPQYLIGRTPPLPAGSDGNATHVVRVPAGTGPVAAKSVNPNIRVFGVEPQDANDTKLSLLSGTRIKIAPPITLADGIRTPQPGALTFPIVQALVEDVIVIDEASILPALRVMVQQIKLVAEPTGAVALAALLSGLLPDACKRVGILVCGGNVEPALLAS